MKNAKYSYAILGMLFCPLAMSDALGQTDHESTHDATGDHATSYPPPFDFSLTESWLDPWPHSHFSRRGTPFIHLFLTEPAFLDRDLFFDFGIARAGRENEMEMEVELEWAITRRLGLVIEMPYVFLRACLKRM